MKLLKKLTTLWMFVAIVDCSAVNAAKSWKILPGDSNLSFTATVNGAPISGKFGKFNGDIKFDPKDLGTSMVKITITMGSVNADKSDMGDNVMGAAWFDVKSFPTATFEARSFAQEGENSFTANGTLTIRNKSVPTTLNFTLNEFSATRAVVTGSANISRLAFGVGTGEWAATDVVKDEVTVNFKVTAQSAG